MTTHDKAPEVFYECPDCYEEGEPELPLTDFYTYDKPPFRSLYCRAHHNMRNSKRQADRLNPRGPHYDPSFHRERKEAWRDYHRRKLDPKSPEYDRALHERQLAAKRQWHYNQKNGRIPYAIPSEPQAEARPEQAEGDT